MMETETGQVRRFHASCAARRGRGVLLFGPSGVGKSDLLLRLMSRGYALVADDRVEMTDGIARAPARLRGLIEVRGWGIVRRSFEPEARVALSVRFLRHDEAPPRLPEEGQRDPETGLPVLYLNGMMASAPERIDLALDCLESQAFLVPQGAMLVSDD